MPVYTKKGDRGETGLPGGRRVSKDDPVFWFLGNLDEANSAIGLAISQLGSKHPAEIAGLLDVIQPTLLSIGSSVANNKLPDSLSKRLEKMTKAMEEGIDDWEASMPELKNFIQPGGTVAAATLHLARAFTRRAERSFRPLPMAATFTSVSQYLNRLSDYLFVAARQINYRQGYTDKVWQSQDF